MRKKGSVILVLLVASVFLPLFSSYLVIPARALPVEGWVNRYTYDVDYGNRSHTSTSHIGVQAFWNNETSTWEELLFKDRSDAPIPHYLLRNAHISARVGLYDGEDAVLYYDPDMTRKICAERWNVRAYVSGGWEVLDKTFFSHEVFYNDTFINVTGIFKTWYTGIHVGWLRVSYLLRPARLLKHEVAYRNIYAGSFQHQVVMTLVGIAGTKVIHRLGETTVTLTEKQIDSPWLRFVNASNPKYQFLGEKLDSLGYYEFNETTGEEVWVNEYLKAIRVKLVDYWGKQLVRCDVVIGNYTLAENEILFIDPDSDTFYTSAGDGHCYMYAGGTWNTNHDASASSYASHTFSEAYCYSFYTGSWGIARTFFPFDTSTIPAGSTISLATLKLYCVYVQSAYNKGTRSFAMVKTTQASTSSLTTGDYDQCGAINNPSEGASRQTITATGWVTWTFTDPDNWVTKEGWTKLGVRSGWRDCDDIAPTSTECAYIRFSTSESANDPELYVEWEASGGDETAPTYSDVGTNSTSAGQPCLFYTKWTDETGLATTGGYVFGTNNTGSWNNETWTAFTSNPDWSNVTKTLNATIHIRVEWQTWANDTSDNWNTTGLQGFNTIGMFPVDVTLSVSTSLSGTRELELDRSITQSVGVATSGDRFGAFSRIFTQSLGVQGASSTLNDLLRSESLTLSVATSGTRTLDLDRSIDLSTSIGILGSRLLDMMRTTSLSVVVSPDMARLLDAGRDATLSVGVSGDASRSLDLERGISSSVAVSPDVSRLLDLGRNPILSVSVASDITNLLELERRLTSTISVNVASDPVVLFNRLFDVEVSTSPDMSRQLDLYRSISQSINTALSILEEHISPLLKSMSLSIAVSPDVTRLLDLERSLALSISTMASIARAPEPVAPGQPGVVGLLGLSGILGLVGFVASMRRGRRDDEYYDDEYETTYL